jgi:hypothetical protein
MQETGLLSADETIQDCREVDIKYKHLDRKQDSMALVKGLND